jgi:hypothetical protein
MYRKEDERWRDGNSNWPSRADIRKWNTAYGFPNYKRKIKSVPIKK